MARLGSKVGWSPKKALLTPSHMTTTKKYDDDDEYDDDDDDGD